MGASRRGGPGALPGWAWGAGVGWVLCYALGVALLRDPSVRRFQSDLLYAVPDLAGAVTASWACRRWRGGGNRRHGAAWGWLAVSCGCSLAADLVYAGYYYLAGRDDVFPSWADPLWVLAEVAVLPTVVLAFGRVSRLRRGRAVLDAAVATLGLGSVLWVLLLAPELRGGWTVGAGITVAYPVLDLAVLVLLLSVGVSGHRRLPAAVLLLAGGSLLLAGTDLLSAYASNLHSYVDGSWFEVGWQAAAVLTWWAALSAGRRAARFPPRPGPVAGAGAAPLPDGTADPGAEALTLDREVVGLAPVLAGVGAVLALVAVQAVQGRTSGAVLALAAGTVTLVVTRLLLSVADQRAVSRQLDAALAEQQRLAITDVLTELYNRRFTEELLRLEVGAACRDGGRVAVLLIDVDHFKAVNDTHGHQAGDAVLAETAVRLHRGLRDVDVLGRWGGEEFLAVLRGADADTAMQVAERARWELAGSTIRLASGVRLTVTASVGVSVVPPHGCDADTVLHEADQALYQAKQDGRDRSRLATGATYGLPVAPGARTP